MKTLKLFTALVFILLSTNLLFAGNPQKTDKTTSATLMVEKLGNDIVLTDSQKVAIQKIAEEYIGKRQEANALEEKDVAISMKMEAEQEYKMALENLLSEEQRMILQEKQEERNRTPSK